MYTVKISACLQEELCESVSPECCDKIKALIEADKPKPKFEPIEIDGLKIFVDEAPCPIRVENRPGSGTVYSLIEVDRIIVALQDAKAHVKADR